MAIRPQLPHPISEVVTTLRSLTREWLQFLVDLVRATPVTGTIAFSAATTAAVTFDVPEQSTSYEIVFASPEDNYFWATSKTVSGFTANAKSSTSATVGWTLMRR